MMMWELRYVALRVYNLSLCVYTERDDGCSGSKFNGWENLCFVTWHPESFFYFCEVIYSGYCKIRGHTWYSNCKVFCCPMSIVDLAITIFVRFTNHPAASYFLIIITVFFLYQILKIQLSIFILFFKIRRLSKNSDNTNRWVCSISKDIKNYLIIRF